MESKAPATWLGRKDSMSVVPEFCKHLYTSSRRKGEERGSLKEFIRAVGKRAEEGEAGPA